MSSPKSNQLRCLDILRGIKENSIDPASLLPSQRKLIVPVLVAEGQSTAEIAHLLKVSDRTIERDKQAIRQENAISQDPELASVFAGRLVDEAQICIQRIRKFQRDNDCPPAAKIDGERACFRIFDSLAERLQSMGFLPTTTQKLEADLNHHVGDSHSLDEVVSEGQRLLDIKASLPVKKVKNIESKTVKQKGKNNE